VACRHPWNAKRRRLSAVPLPQTVAEDRANPQLALPRSARSRGAEPIQRASGTPPKNRAGKLHRRALRESVAAAEASQHCWPGARRT
jgi:hypothetical protein